MPKRTTVCCPFCRCRMQPHFPEPDSRKYWLCKKCEVVFFIQQMAWYPIEKESAEMMKND